MNREKKLLSITISSLLLFNLSACMKKNTISDLNNSEEKSTITAYSRTISKNEKVNPLNQNTNLEDLYDYNYGLIGRSPVGEIYYPPVEQTFSADDVNKIRNDLTNEYNNYLTQNSKEYEDYINSLVKKYNDLSNDYNELLKLLEELLADENTDTPPSDNNEMKTDTKNLVESIYEEALKNAADNLEEFEHIQGQAPKK